MLLEQNIWLGTSPKGPVTMLPHMANRHGLISGATGTGKTVTLQVMAEGFSKLGVPVFMADVKGDLAGLAKPGDLNEKVRQRLATCGVEHFDPQACPVTFWDVYGKSGHPVRTTVSEMGPLLLGRMLGLNDTQSGVLHIVFRIADDESMLLIDLKDLRAMLSYVGDNASYYTLSYGNVSKASVGAIQRAIAVLEDQGGNQFFGEPALDIADWFVKDEAGQGMINILAADQLFLRPKMYSSFLLWMLGALYDILPEQGDGQMPQMVFFFDEAHLLFSDIPRALLDKVEMTIRLIRSKGVGVFFVTQNPMDVPSTVLSQLGARVQHALRAFTPQEQRVVKTISQTFRANPAFNTEEAIMNLGTGEALLSFIQEDGSPSITQKALILPPQSQIGAISDTLRTSIVDTSELKGKYDQTFDRESAYEVLTAKYMSQGVVATAVVEAQQPVEASEPPVVRAQTFKVFDPKTGTYVDRELVQMQPTMPQSAPQQPAAPVYAPQPQQPQRAITPRQQTMPAPSAPPVLVYNPQSGQYEPQDLSVAPVKPVKQAAQPRAQKTVAERMFESFTRSTASGAGYSVGRSITRNILGVFGIK